MKYKTKYCSAFISAAVLVIVLAGITLSGFDTQLGPDQNKAQALVTLEDIIETLPGMEIIDEMDSVANMREMARQQWLKRAKALGFDTEYKLIQKGRKYQKEQKKID